MKSFVKYFAGGALGVSLVAVPANAFDWWVAPTPGWVRIFYDVGPPDRIDTIPIDGVNWSTVSGGGGEVVVGTLMRNCDGSDTQSGRLYPHTNYTDVFVENC